MDPLFFLVSKNGCPISLAVIIRLIHQNQYGFIKFRTIQDFLAWTFEYLHICKTSRKDLVIIKLDFEKAFNKIEHQAIVDNLKHKGFGDIWWLGWIKDIIITGTSSVLLNELPGKTFLCKRDLRQWDPLSPLLFVLAADLLQTVINNAKDQGLLKLPIITGASNDFPVIQYAHDTLVIMEACPTQLTVLKDLLNTFAQSTWLKVNYSKSVMVPLNISDGNLDQLANLFNCQKGTLPFTYLGLPLGINKPNIEDFLPLFQRIERRLTSTSSILCQGGKLEMVNTVLSSSVVFQISSLKLHKGVIKQLDKYRKHYLWKGSNLGAKKTLQSCVAPGLSPQDRGGIRSHWSYCPQQCPPTQVPSQVLHEMWSAMGQSNLELILQWWLTT